MKKAIFIMLALALTFSLTGCRDTDSDGTVTATPSPGMSSPSVENESSGKDYENDDSLGDDIGEDIRKGGENLREGIDDIMGNDDRGNTSASPRPGPSEAVE